MTKDSRELLARIGTALYEPDALTRQEADTLYDTLDALVAEVERLRAEVDAERAAVVAWLCAWQGQMDDRITHDDADYAISVIKRGDHRREEER